MKQRGKKEQTNEKEAKLTASAVTDCLLFRMQKMDKRFKDKYRKRLSDRWKTQGDYDQIVGITDQSQERSGNQPNASMGTLFSRIQDIISISCSCI